MTKTGLIAGQGDLPFLMADALRSQGRECFVLAIKGDTKPELVENLPHEWIEMAEIARTMEIFREHGVSDIVMAGKLSRPPIKALKPPALAAKILKRLGTAFFKGDDALFKAIVSIFEEEGFAILGADEVLKDLLTPKATLTQTQPADMMQVEHAAEAARNLGARDLGQAIIWQKGTLLAEETVDGTDVLITQTGKADGAILAKMKKPNQERRVDLPTIGPDTIKALAEYGYAGVVLEAEHSLILHREEVIELADRSGLFVVGI